MEAEEAAAGSVKFDTPGVTIFCCVAFLLAWLLALPLWFSRSGLADPLAVVFLAAMMFCPTIAVLAVLLFRPQSIKPVGSVTGLVVHHWKRLFLYCLLTWLTVLGLVLAALFVGAVFGFYHFDLKSFSGFVDLIGRSPKGAELLSRVPIGFLVLLQFLSLTIAPFVNAPFAFGEEWGWRGFLLPKLLPLGQWPALIFSGAMWGFWHAPVVLLGFDYPQHRELGVILMVAFCVIIGILIGWLRLASGSIWPCVVAHGTLNGCAGVPYMLADAKSSFDTAQVTILGWTGWILPLLLIALLILTRRLPVKLSAPGTTVS